jgi:hypothetical protein
MYIFPFSNYFLQYFSHFELIKLIIVNILYLSVQIYKIMLWLNIQYILSLYLTVYYRIVEYPPLTLHLFNSLVQHQYSVCRITEFHSAEFAPQYLSHHYLVTIYLIQRIWGNRNWTGFVFRPVVASAVN